MQFRILIVPICMTMSGSIGCRRRRRNLLQVVSYAAKPLDIAKRNDSWIRRSYSEAADNEMHYLTELKPLLKKLLSCLLLDQGLSVVAV